MAAGDLILDASGNEVLDGAGDLVLDGTTPCADCCACTTYYQVKTCDETATYYVCCKGSPPAIDTVLDLGGGFTAVNSAGGHVDVGHLCLKVTSACAALPMGGKIISLPKAGPDSAVCTDQFCKPCPLLCCNFTFDFSGIEIPGCLGVILHPRPFGDGYGTRILVRGTKAPTGKAAKAAVLAFGFGCELTDNTDAATRGFLEGPACSWESYYTSSDTCAVHSDSPPFPVSQFGWHTTATTTCTVFYLIERTCLTVKVSIAVCAAVDDFGARPSDPLPYPAAFYAEGPLIAAAWFSGSTTADINPAGDTVLTIANTQTLQDPDTHSTARCLGWPIATDGHCTVTISCTPQTKYCFWKFKATCDGAGGWVVAFVQSICSPSDIDIDWTPSGPDANQIKIVKSIACGGGGSCADPMDADFPAPPADASPCVVIHLKCVWLIVARVQCLSGIPAWTFTNFFRGCEDPALEPEHDWADPVTDGSGNIISMDKVVHVSGCSTFSDCSTTPPLVSAPTNPITFNPCAGVCLYHFFANKVPGSGWVVTQDPGTPICAPAGTMSTPWVDTNSSCDALLYERDVVTIGCAGGDCPPTIALPDPPGVITFPDCSSGSSGDGVGGF